MSMKDFQNLERLPEIVRKKIVPYLTRLRQIHGNNILSIAVYGSATGKDFSPRTSDINVAVIFDKLDFSDLKSSLKLISHGIPQKITAPLFLTRKHVNTSQDVFPIEFLDMKESSILVYGEDILGNLQINDRNLRLQCESQIKGKLIRIRQAYLEIGLKGKGIEALLKNSLNSLIPIFRNLLRLKGKVPPVDKEEILKQLAEEFSIESDVFLTIFRDKREDERIGLHDVEVFFEKYLTEIQKLAITVDVL